MPKVNNKDTDINDVVLGRSGVFIVNFQHISQLFQVFLLLNLNK